MEKFEDVIEKMMLERGMPPINDKVMIHIKEADKVLYRAALWYFKRVGREFVPMPQYREVAEWLADNEGKGLFLQGNHGQGKTILAKYIIPAVLLYYARLNARYFTSVSMSGRLKEIFENRIIVIDDIGVEHQIVEFGNRRNLMDEIMDDVEQNGKLIILTTNLDEAKLREKYGEGVLDRIAASTRRIVFEGRSLRKKQ